MAEAEDQAQTETPRLRFHIPPTVGLERYPQEPQELTADRAAELADMLVDKRAGTAEQTAETDTQIPHIPAERVNRQQQKNSQKPAGLYTLAVAAAAGIAHLQVVAQVERAEVRMEEPTQTAERHLQTLAAAVAEEAETTRLAARAVPAS